ncbi:MAG: transcriptional repressor [Omnitrophica bacterium]|nr:transcriptional repressor [Candidatus Omnitrophota bacterium]
MDKTLNLFIDFLKKQNLKLTKQREEVLGVFLKTEKHLTVEELYNIIKKKDPHIGQATVFRTLKLIREAGIATEADLGDKKIRYEHRYGHKHHDHLICIKCGRFIEVVEPEIEKLQNKLCRDFRFLVERHRLEIFGVCQQCRRKDRRPKKR